MHGKTTIKIELLVSTSMAEIEADILLRHMFGMTL
jgi:hypothetical protein